MIYALASVFPLFSHSLTRKQLKENTFCRFCFAFSRVVERERKMAADSLNDLWNTDTPLENDRHFGNESKKRETVTSIYFFKV